MAERKILSGEIRQAVLSETAEIIENYSEDKYAPSCLIFGIIDNERKLHIQVNIKGVVVTVYDPESIKWNSDFKTRRK